MIVAAILLQAASPEGLLAADRALAVAVATEGEYSGFRRFAANDAIMFYGGPHPARKLLANRQNPAVAISWRVAELGLSCDGTTAYTIGPVTRPSAKPGSLLLVWRRDRSGSWKWVAWRGSASGAPRRFDTPLVRVAACTGSPPTYIAQRLPGTSGSVWSPDRTLLWDWHASPAGVTRYTVRLWDGRTHVAWIAGGDDQPVQP